MDILVKVLQRNRTISVVCVCVHREREIYFKELTRKSKIHRAGQQLETQAGFLCHSLEEESLLFLCETSFFALKALK